MYVIRDRCVIGGDKDVSLFGDLTFKRIHVTNDARLANHLQSKVNYTVTEVSDASELLEYLQDTSN